MAQMGSIFRRQRALVPARAPLADQLAAEKVTISLRSLPPAENAFVFSLVDTPRFWTGFNGSGGSSR